MGNPAGYLAGDPGAKLPQLAVQSIGQRLYLDG